MPHTTATVRDVAYADRGATPLQFDLHYATDAGPLPLVLYFHGGGWARGARTDAEQARIIPMAAAGFAVASVSYRLSGTDVWPAQLEDARTAFDAVPEIVAGLGVPLSGRTTVWGSSAGGHIALMLALTAAERGLPGPAAAVALFPPADLTRVTTAPLPETTRRPPFVPADGPLPAFERALLALDRAADPESAQREASPVSHATAAAPPILLLHGDEDGLISPWHTARLLRALREAGAPATALYVAGATHEDPACDTAVIRAAVAAHLRGEPGDR